MITEMKKKLICLFFESCSRSFKVVSQSDNLTIQFSNNLTIRLLNNYPELTH
jgi:hypothetical protein